MKILMLNYEFPPIGGGAANANLYILRQFAQKNDLQIDMLTSGSSPRFSLEKFSPNINIHRIGLHKKSLQYWRKIEVIEWLIKAKAYYGKLIAAGDYDLAHAFFGFPTAYVCLPHSKKLPFIISLRGSDVPGQNPRLSLDYKILGPLFKKIWRNAAAVVACSEGLKQRANRFMPELPIAVIPNGVNLEKFRPRQDMSFHKPLRLLTVGRLSETKRVELLIEAVDLMRKKGIDVRFTIAGSGRCERKLKSLSCELGLDDCATFTGRIEQDDMPQVYRDHDIYVSATFQEGMSNAMLEAMASGLPIVTTDCEGVEELVDGNGVIVLPQAQQIAEAVQKIASDPQTYSRMSDSARNMAKKFSWSNIADTYLACYYDCLAEKRSN